MVRKFLIKNHAYFIEYDVSNIKIKDDSEVCLNWWPISSGICIKTHNNMIHPLCKVCANWIPDIEDIINCSKCINEYQHTS